ncbi:MAG: DUF4390 domain-containing protein [Desulfobacterales bacterium]|nr:DUF4390 domain-containing protein [Desulfobacterales bacterium]
MIRKAAILTFALFFLQHGTFSRGAGLENIVVTNTRDDLLLYLNVSGAFTEKIKKAILSGVPTTFSFYITLYRARNMWFDKNIADLKITHRIKYNSLKKEFSINRSWATEPSSVTTSLEQAKKLMTDIDSLKIIPLSRLEKGMQYQIRAKAELSKQTLPLYLHYLLFFVSLWDFETDWYTVDFIY